MINLCDQLHELFNSKKRFYFPFDKDKIPQNGIYIIFEKGEKYKHWNRIVRIGSHTGQNQLRSRLNQHFINENKNRSIFRKNIGRCFLNKENHPYLKIWDIDTTSRKNKIEYSNLIDKDYEKKLERKISTYIQDNISFTVFEIQSKDDRLFWEKRIISTLIASPDFSSSLNWLGRFSPKDKIRQYGLWQVNELFNKILDTKEFNELTEIIK